MSTLDKIAIVDMGCIYPGADNTKELWNICVEGKNLFQDLPSERWDIDVHFSSDRTLPDKTYSRLSASISEAKFNQLLSELSLDQETTRLEAYLTHSLNQMRKSLSKCEGPRTGMVLGLMNPDEEYSHGLAQLQTRPILEKARQLTDHTDDLLLLSEVEELFRRSQVEKWLKRDRYISSEILERVCKKFGIAGTQFIVDAACASSLASVDLGIELIQARVLDNLVVGGAESNLSPGMFAVFSRVGALAETTSAPFDKKTQGLIQSEGAGLFVIKRLRDAIEQNDQILAVIDGCDGSSDGKTSSLFQPNTAGQIESYRRVYGDQPEFLTYLEAHGTGTPIGDRTELQSLSDFFSNQTLAVGSVKSLIGHSKGAAGAAGLIKSIFCLNEGVIPGAPYLESLAVETDKIISSKQAIQLDSGDTQRAFGVSAFGFGGTNFHLTLKNQNTLKDYQGAGDQETSWLGDPVVIGESEIAFKNFDPNWFLSAESFYRIPPQSIDRIDKSQLLAVQATYEAFQDSGFPLEFLPKKDIVTISASVLGLDLGVEMAARLQASVLPSMIRELFSDLSNKSIDRVCDLVEQVKQTYLPCSEDHAPGVLNNVVAGRICHAFDFKGRSYNIEAPVHTLDYALFLAHLEIRLRRSPLVVVVCCEEKEETPRSERFLARESIICKIVTSEKLCKDFMIQPKSRIVANVQ